VIVTRFKSEEEIYNVLKPFKKLVFIGCNICAAECNTSGEKILKEYKEKFEQKGFEVVYSMLIEGMCNQNLVKRDIKKFRDIEYDAVISFACGAGTQSVMRVGGKNVITLLNTIYLARKPRVGSFTESCIMCGDCMLNQTMVCPKTRCSKGITNGPCGGSVNGCCEVDPDRKCAWVEIYEKLEEKGETWRIEKIFQPLKNVNESKPRKDLNK